MNPRRPYLWLALILLIALSLRIPLMFHEGLWLDEFFTLELSSGRGLADWHLPRGQILVNPPDLTALSGAPPWWKIPSHLSEDPHPPLFYILMRFWRDAFGSSRAALRSLPLLFSLISILVIYYIGKTRHDSAIGLLAALMLALASPQMIYSVETRNYSMMVLTALLLTAALVEIERHGPDRVRIACFGAVVLTALFTNYFTFFVLLGLLFWSFWVFPPRSARRAALAALTALIIFALLWLPSVLRQAHTIQRVNSVPGSPAITSAPAQAVSHALLMPIRQIVPNIGADFTAAVLAILGYAIAWIFLRHRRDLLLYICWLIPTVVALFLFDLLFSGQFALIRYTLAIGPAVFLFLAAWPMKLPVKSRLVCSLIGPVACLCFVHTAFYRWKGDWPQMARYVASRTQPTDLIAFIDSSQDVFDGYRYIGIRYYIPRWRHPIILLGTISAPRFGHISPTYSRIWVVSNMNAQGVQMMFPDYHIGPDHQQFEVGDVTELIRSNSNQ